MVKQVIQLLASFFIMPLAVVKIDVSGLSNNVHCEYLLNKTMVKYNSPILHTESYQQEGVLQLYRRVYVHIAMHFKASASQ